MNRSAAFEVKGWCPGALRPMQSGDGLVVRIRPRSGTLSPHELRVLADAARRFGNGHIDLTRRANLQLRGISEGSLPRLHEVIARLGLLDDSPDGEAVRNVMISPLAGIDPAEVLDARGVGRELERRLASEKSSGRCRPSLASSSTAVVFCLLRGNAPMFVLWPWHMVRRLCSQSASRRRPEWNGLAPPRRMPLRLLRSR